MQQTPKTLQEAIQYFSDEQTCIDTVAHLRWADGKPTCPACEGKEHYYLATQKRWKCKECGRQFSVKLGTIFEDSALSLDKWLIAMWMIVNCRNGVSSYEIARTLGITQKSAWFMMHRIRLALSDAPFNIYPNKIGGSGNTVEVDETYIGGKLKNMHRKSRRRFENYGGATGKTIVMGLLDRDNRKVRAKTIPNTTRQTLQKEVLSLVKYGSTVHTDNAVGYDNLSYRFEHEVINHAIEYCRDRVTTNGIENFWSLLKRGLQGTYVAVEPFHLDRYLDEQVFRFNNRKDGKRKVTDAERFERALSQVKDRRLTLSALTGKAATATRN